MKKYQYKLYGAILGDLAGQPFEFPIMQTIPENVPIHNPDSHITDDTLMTLASAKSLIDGTPIEECYKDMGKRYPGDYFAKGFKAFLIFIM